VYWITLIVFVLADIILQECNFCFLKGFHPTDVFLFQGAIEQETFGSETQIHFRPPVFAKWAGATTGRIGSQPQPRKVESAQLVLLHLSKLSQG
jgi:hypothetical protein